MAYGSVLGRNTKPQFVPTFAISGPLPGDTVTVSYGGTTVEAVEDNGVWYAKAWAYGSYTVTLTATVGTKSTTVNVDEVKLYEITLTNANTTLNSNSWSVIRAVADAGQASNYWNVGDTKSIVLNGTVGHLSLSNYTIYAFIIGIDHNASLEGTNCIHFQIGKTALSGGKSVCFYDNYGSYVSETGYFSMNASATTVGGWASSQMRNNICGTSLTSYSGTVIAVIPDSLRSVLKSVIKFTDNIGNTSISENAVTATTDYFFLLSEYEVYMNTKYCNPYEASKQAQYAYYSAGNSKIMYKYNSTGTPLDWSLRSQDKQYYNYFAQVYTDGASSSGEANVSFGFSPCFCV